MPMIADPDDPGELISFYVAQSRVKTALPTFKPTACRPASLLFTSAIATTTPHRPERKATVKSPTRCEGRRALVADQVLDMHSAAGDGSCARLLVEAITVDGTRHEARGDRGRLSVRSDCAPSYN